MPIYEYACDKCKTEFEVEQRITDEPVKSCPHCKSRKIRRLISRTSFVLKGGGWYSDLYASSGAKDAKAATADSGEGGSADSKAEPKGETKSADTAKTAEKGSAKRKDKAKAARR